MKKEYEVGFLLSRTTWAMNNFVNRLLKEKGLNDISVAYLAVLQALWEEDGLSISELGEKVQLEKSTMTSLIDRMEKVGLLKRVDHPADRRAYQIYLTFRGKSIQEKVDQVASAAYQSLTKGISEKDLKVSVEVCKQILQNAERGGEQKSEIKR